MTTSTDSTDNGDERVVLWIADDDGTRPTRIPGLVVAGSPVGEYGLSAAGTEDHRPLSLGGACDLLGCSIDDVRSVAAEHGLSVSTTGAASEVAS